MNSMTYEQELLKHLQTLNKSQEALNKFHTSVD